MVYSDNLHGIALIAVNSELIRTHLTSGRTCLLQGLHTTSNHGSHIRRSTLLQELLLVGTEPDQKIKEKSE